MSATGYGYTMPGMQIYPVGAYDSPSGDVGVPIATPRGLQGPGVSANVAYSGSVDVNSALLIFAILYFGTVGALHFMSNRAGRI